MKEDPIVHKTSYSLHYSCPVIKVRCGILLEHDENRMSKYWKNTTCGRCEKTKRRRKHGKSVRKMQHSG